MEVFLCTRNTLRAIHVRLGIGTPQRSQTLQWYQILDTINRALAGYTTKQCPIRALVTSMEEQETSGLHISTERAKGSPFARCSLGMEDTRSDKGKCRGYMMSALPITSRRALSYLLPGRTKGTPASPKSRIPWILYSDPSCPLNGLRQEYHFGKLHAVLYGQRTV